MKTHAGILLITALALLASGAHAQSHSTGENKRVRQTFSSVNNYGITDDGIMRHGEPVPGAEIYIELEGDPEAVAKVASDSAGVFQFSVKGLRRFPGTGTLSLTVIPSKAYAKGRNISAGKQHIRVRFIKPSDETFRFVLFHGPVPSGASESKASFAVSGLAATSTTRPTMCCCLGGEIYVEIEPDDVVKIADFTTDENGVLSFVVNPAISLPSQGVLRFAIVPTPAFAKRYGVSPTKQEVRQVYRSVPKGRRFEFRICWEPEGGKAQNKGTFAVSGKSDS